MKHKNNKWKSRVWARKSVSVGEDWFPTIDGLVCVSLIEFDDHTWRVSAWGGDDLGMDISGVSESRARFIFDRITHLVTRDELSSLGLERV